MPRGAAKNAAAPPANRATLLSHRGLDKNRDICRAFGRDSSARPRYGRITPDGGAGPPSRARGGFRVSAAKWRASIIVSVVATAVFGLVGMSAAHADGILTVTPNSSLADGQMISVTLDGFTPGPLVSVQIAECGNAYADGTALPSTLTVTTGVLDSVNCEVIGFQAQGTMTTSPVTISGPQVTARQTSIGNGDRSCIASPPALEPCFVYVSTSVNMPSFPTQDLSFTDPSPSGGEPAATAITMTAVGTPVGLGKTAHAFVQVTAPSDPSLMPEGQVQVFEGASLLGSGTLAADATASIAIGTPALGSHDLTASYLGNGSFLPSGPASATLAVVGANNISIGDSSTVEGNTNGTRTMMFPVVLSKPPTTSVSVNYSVVPTGSNPAVIGTTATPGTNVIAQAKTLTFKAGPGTIKYITVKIVGDTVNEGNMTFAVQLTDNANNGGYVLRRPIGNGLIIDDDSPTSSARVVSLGNSAVPEGDVGGAHAMKFMVSLSSPSSTTVTVYLQVSNGTATHGTKLSGDWGGAINRKIVFRAGVVSMPLGVAAFPDTVSELDETVKVALLSVATADPNVVLSSTNNLVFGTILSDE